MTDQHTWVCTVCCAGWWNDKTRDRCPHCHGPAESRGAVLVVPLEGVPRVC